MYLQLIGNFRLIGPDAADCTPRASKSRALLAILARTDDAERPRRWLEGCLWSDRGADQAAGSLRQALMGIRKALPPGSDFLCAGRDGVRLGTFESDIARDPVAARQAILSGREFLEGLRVWSPAFAAWLEQERRAVFRELAGCDAHIATAPVVFATRRRARTPVTPGAGANVVPLSLRKTPRRPPLTAPRVLRSRAAADPHQAECVTRAVGLLHGPAVSGLTAADRLLAEANRIAPTARSLAWRGLTLQKRIVERDGVDPDAAQEESAAYLRAAVAADGGDPVVLALAAHVAAVMWTDVARGLDLARRAVRRGPFQPLARNALALALQRAGRTREAHDEAIRALRLAPRGGFGHWLHMMAGQTTLACGDVGAAEAHFRTARAAAPGWAAPLRHLLCLRLADGDHRGSDSLIRTLSTLEPDFDVLRLSQDEAYPVPTLRRLGLIGPRRQVA